MILYMYICIHVYRGIYLGLVFSSGSELLGMHIPVCKSFIVCKHTHTHIYIHNWLRNRIKPALLVVWETKFDQPI